MQTAIVEQPKIDEHTHRAKRRWEEVWGGAVEQKKNWQRIAFVQALLLAFAVWGLIHLGGMPKQILYVLERDKTGAVAYAGPVKPTDMDAEAWNLVKVQALKRFIESWRTVTTDKTAQANDWDRAFLFVGDGSQAKTSLAQWFEKNDPIKRAAQGELVSVHFKTFDMEGAHTFGLWWDETTSSITGQVVSQKSWRARVVYEVHIPRSEQAREENSLGVLITELSWEQVQ